MNPLPGILQRTCPLSQSGTATHSRSRTTNACSSSTISSRNTLMTSMHIHVFPFLQLMSHLSPCSSACSGVENSPPNIRSPSDATQPEFASLEPLRASLRRSIHDSGLSIPPLSQMHSTPIVPPPAMRTCKRDPASIPRRVVHPARESCYKYVIIHISFHRLITSLPSVLPS